MMVSRACLVLLSILFLVGTLTNCDSENSGSTNGTLTNTAEDQAFSAPKEPKIEWPNAKNLVPFFTKYGQENPETVVNLNTRLGRIVIKLYKDTPLHRANFIHHIKRGLYYKSIFYRAVPKFLIQGGNTDLDETLNERSKIGAYAIPSERSPDHIHKRGALAMAMTYEHNPNFESAQFSFYIVIGEKFTDERLNATEREYEMKIPESARKVYKTIGGTPHLDARHTVFGEVIEGMDVVEAVANEPRDSGDWPINDVIIEFSVEN